jgi:hypothetical protein
MTGAEGFGNYPTQAKGRLEWGTLTRFFIKFDKIRSFWVFWGMRSECMGFGSVFSEGQRRRAKGFFPIEKGTLVSGAKAA